MRPLVALLVLQVALAGVLVALVATDSVPFVDADGGGASVAGTPRPAVDRFDSRAAFRFLRAQVALGPRPAGSAASGVLARRIRRMLPGGRFQAVPGGLRNVIGVVRGRRPRRLVVVGAHYDTKDLPGFLGANDGASGTAVVVQLARSLRPRRLRPTILFALFDGEESPAGAPEGDFERTGLRGSRVAARRYRRAEAMVLLDFVGDKDLRIPRESYSDTRLWSKLRRAARRVAVGGVFPAETQTSILDDHVPFLHAGVPAIDLIDFEFPCFHRPCDDLSAVSERSLDAVGEAVLELLRGL